MKHKVSDLEGPLLARAVALALNGWRVYRDGPDPSGEWICQDGAVHSFGRYGFRPDVRWEHGGPIIERERISIIERGSEWAGDAPGFHVEIGPTPLIAAMRAYVVSKLGEEVELDP